MKFSLDPLNVIFQLIFTIPICIAYAISGFLFSFATQTSSLNLNWRTPISFLLGTNSGPDIFTLSTVQVFKWILFYTLMMFIYTMIIWFVAFLIEKCEWLFRKIDALDLIDKEKYMMASLDKVIVDVDIMTNDGNWVYCGRVIRREENDIDFHGGCITLKNVLKVDKDNSFNSYVDQKRNALINKKSSQNLLKRMAFPKNNITSINFRVNEKVSKRKIKLPKA